MPITRRLAVTGLLTAAWAEGFHREAQAFSALPATSSADGLRVRPVRPRQGDALLVRLDQPEVEEMTIRWRHRNWPAYRLGRYWFGAVPISPDSRPGGYTVKVMGRWPGSTELRELARKVEVARVAYPVQHLRMARSTASLYNYPGVEEENRVIGTAIRTVSEERLWRGDWMLPCPGRFSTLFGEQRIRNGKPVGRHRGLDIAAKTGVPVQAAARGRVVLAGSWPKHGTTVVLDHGLGITSFYIHMSAVHAQEGDLLERGEVLGEVGSTGVSTGPHLHWSIYVHGEPVEPLLFCRLSRRGVGI